MSQPNRPLIVGARPVGLGAALFLARHGQVPRVVEMRDEPSQQSKALAVNPRTLDILEPTGITRRMLELGLPVYGVRFYRQGRVAASIPLAGIHPKYFIELTRPWRPAASTPRGMRRTSTRRSVRGG
jgi:2-polyprenyl-6-methoxyphenol hydroxylase-like FAD-dependent oxidoreductase